VSNDQSAPTLSVEFFPPKDISGEERLWQVLAQLAPLKPDFVSVTYGAGGSTRDRTIRVTTEITARTSIPTVAHLTCVGSTKSELSKVLDQYKKAGIESILALRGDPPGGPRSNWQSIPGGFDHADQLVELAIESKDLKVGVAAFPDGHPSSNFDLDKDIEVLLRKEELGASFATTQFFFDVNKWQQLVERLRKRGSKLPIIAGILPITNLKQLNRMVELSGMQIPEQILTRFKDHSEDVNVVREIGIDIATEMGSKLLEMNVPGIHFYTMNSADSTIKIARNLGLVKR
jgi:methylenetetrahydrofolate reductase (NADPH)